MISGVLEVLDGCFTLYGNATTDENKTAQRTVAVEVATQLLTLPTPVCVQLHTKCLLAALHTTRAAYHSYKVWLICSGMDWCVLCILHVPCLSHLLRLHCSCIPEVKQSCSLTIGDDLKLLNFVREVNGVKILIIMMLLPFLKISRPFYLDMWQTPIPSIFECSLSFRTAELGWVFEMCHGSMEVSTFLNTG